MSTSTGVNLAQAYAPSCSPSDSTIRNLHTCFGLAPHSAKNGIGAQTEDYFTQCFDWDRYYASKPLGIDSLGIDSLGIDSFGIDPFSMDSMDMLYINHMGETEPSQKGSLDRCNSINKQIMPQEPKEDATATTHTVQESHQVFCNLNECSNRLCKVEEFSEHLCVVHPRGKKRRAGSAVGVGKSSVEFMISDGTWLFTRANICGNCQKRFVRKDSFERHMAIHTGKYGCGNCQKRFVRPESLERHMAIHTGKYRCGNCQRRFGHTESLERHQKKCQSRAQRLSK